MGHYVIPLEPKFGKVNIIKQHGGEEIQVYELPDALTNEGPHVYICVVKLQSHEAALVLGTNADLAAVVADVRPTTFLRVPRSRMAQLEGF